MISLNEDYVPPITSSEHSLLADYIFTDGSHPLPELSDYEQYFVDEICFCDTRQHKGHHEDKHYDLCNLGWELRTARLLYGDYCRVGSHYVIDTKRSIEELSQSVVSEKFRNKSVYQRAEAAGFSYIVITENPYGISCVDDLKDWQNPLCYETCPWYNAYMCDAHPDKVCPRFPRVTRPSNGEDLVKAIHQMESQASVYFFFCDPSNTAAQITRFLSLK